MRVPLSWLADYVNLDLAPEQLAERLTMLGFEVKALERRGHDWRSVVVGELLTVAPHPRGDRLSLTTVRVAGETLSIVCGATNIAPGQRVPVALPGAVLPGGRRIERTEKLGVTSNGMLCSGDELGLTADAEGILILSSEAPIGASLADLYGDVVLDVDVKPNRGDALSLVGLAREVSVITGAPVRPPVIEVSETDGPLGDRLRVRVEAPDLCTRFVGRRVAGVAVGPAPERVQMRLLAAGLRPVSNVVDASNYVMLELGKPIHTFDAAAVAEDLIVVRRARTGERLETLDHVARELDPDTLVIADPRGPLAIAGVMGGAASEVASATTDVVIESAIFDPVSIRRTAFRYGLRSEASLRFEKGQEHRLARSGADRAAALIVEWAAGRVAAGVVDTDPDEPPEARLAFRPARVNRLLGTAHSAAEQRALIARAGIDSDPSHGPTAVPPAGGATPTFVEAPAGEVIVARVPSWRRDLEIEADVAEEIARIAGYESIPASLPDTPMPDWRPSPLEVRETVRQTLAGAGLDEVVTHALVRAADARDLAWRRPIPPADGEGSEEGGPIPARNPLSLEHAVLRRSLLPGLLDVVDLNVRRGRSEVAVFELGKGYGTVDDKPHEWWRLGLALAGSFDRPSWNRPARAADLGDAKGLLELLAEVLGLSAPAYGPLTDEPHLHPGRAAVVEAQDAHGSVGLSGRVGEVHPALVASRDLRVERVVLAEVSIRGLEGGQLPVVRAVPPSRFPAVERDVALIADDARPASAVAALLRSAGGPLLRDVRLFDVYRGAPLGADQRSLAFRLRFEAERTLTEAEIDEALAGVAAAIEDAGLARRA